MNKALLVTVLVAITVGSAFADQLQFTGLNTDPGLHVTVDLNLNSTVYHVAAAKLNFNDITTGTSITTICADLTQSLNGSVHNYGTSIIPVSGNAGLDLAAQIVGANFSVAIDYLQQAALQLAAWDAIYNDGANFDLSGAAPHLSLVSWNGTPASDQATILADASAYYSNGLNAGAHSTYYQTQDAGGQSQLAPVPEPLSIAALGMGLIGLIKRRKSNA